MIWQPKSAPKPGPVAVVPSIVPRGIYPGDPTSPPVPPPNSEAYELRDRHGTLIGWGMVWPQFAGNEDILAIAFEMLDIMDPPTASDASGPRLQLLSGAPSACLEDPQTASSPEPLSGLHLV